MPDPADSRASSLGDDALELRAQLGTALYALSALTVSSGGVSVALHTLQALQISLHEPLLLLAAGEPEAGKSTLLKALFGRELSPPDAVANPGKIQVFKYDAAARTTAVSPLLTEHFLPLPFLRDFHVVELPAGMETPAGVPQIFRENFAPRADAILMVVNSVDPWGESPWRLLENLPTPCLKSVVFVIQQADLRDARELEAISNHLRRTAIAQFGKAFPLFAVSAKKAWLAKTSGIDKARLWTESGLGPLEKQLSVVLNTGEKRLEKLRHITSAARRILRDLGTSTRQAEAATTRERERLNKLRELATQLRQASIGQIQNYLHDIERACQRVEREGEGLLQARLRPWQTFLQRNDWLEGFQKKIEARLLAALNEQVWHIAELLEGELRLAWRQFREQLSPKEMPRPEAAGAEFNFPRAQLVEEMQRALAAQIEDASFGQRLEEQLAAIGTFGSRQPLLAAYHTGMAEKRARLANVVGDLVLQAVEIFYLDLAASYGQVERLCQTQEERSSSLLERVKTLEENFAGIAARLI